MLHSRTKQSGTVWQHLLFRICLYIDWQDQELKQERASNESSSHWTGMEKGKKSSHGESHRSDRCLLIVALCLSAVSILLAIACGISVISIRETNLEFEAKLKRLEERGESGHKIAFGPYEHKLEAIFHDLKMIGKGQKTGNVKRFLLVCVYLCFLRRKESTPF